MKGVLLLALSLASVGAAATSAKSNAAGLTPVEERRKQELQERLCTVRELSCAYVVSVFKDPRMQIYYPPKPASQESPQREKERNPFLTTRFGLLTPESLERCRGFLQAHAVAFDAAYKIYGVPPKIICGILRIETNFGIPTKLAPNPVGTHPAINRLVTLYVRWSSRERSPQQSARWQAFAVHQLRKLLAAGQRFGWDLFTIPGSSTGAIGLAQFEPSSLNLAVDGNGDGKIDLFDPADAIVSVANYLAARGWDNEPQRQQRAIYAYYGGNYDSDPKKYYMRAVLKYAAEVDDYLKRRQQESEFASTPRPF